MTDCTIKGKHQDRSHIKVKYLKLLGEEKAGQSWQKYLPVLWSFSAYNLPQLRFMRHCAAFGFVCILLLLLFNLLPRRHQNLSDTETGCMVEGGCNQIKNIFAVNPLNWIYRRWGYSITDLFCLHTLVIRHVCVRAHTHVHTYSTCIDATWKIALTGFLYFSPESWLNKTVTSPPPPCDCLVCCYVWMGSFKGLTVLLRLLLTCKTDLSWAAPQTDNCSPLASM